MLVSTLIIAFLAAFTIYYEHQIIMGLAMFQKDLKRREALVNDLLHISPTIPEMDGFIDPTEIDWFPLMLGQNLTILNEIATDSNGEATSLGVYALVSGAALFSIFLLNHYIRRRPLIQQNNNAPPPRHHHSSARPSHSQQLQQRRNRRLWQMFEEFEQLQQHDFNELIEDIEQTPHRLRQHMFPPRQPQPLIRLFRSPSPPPPYSPPPPPYSPPPQYSLVDPNPSLD